MANPLKVLVDLQARRNVAVSGTLEVTGSTTLGTATITSADINGGTIDNATIATSDITVGSGKTLNVSAGTLTLAAGQVTADKVGQGTFNAGTYSFNGSTISNLGSVTTADINGGTIDGASIGASSQSTGQFTTISGSSTLQAGGAATLAGGLTVTGAALNASAVAVSASALNVTNNISARSGSFSGDVTITGNLTVLGTPTQIVSNTVNIGDKNINLGTGSADPSVLNEGGIDLGTGAEVQWRYNNSSTAWKSNVHVDVASTKVYKINGTEVLSATKLGDAVISSSLQTLGTLTGLTVNGATQLTGNLNVSGGYIYAPATGSTTNYSAAVTSGIVNIPHALGLLSDAVASAGITAGQVEAAYNKVRIAVTGAFDGNGHAEVNLVTAATALGADVAKFKGLQKHYLSIDVLVRNGSADADWENDLVAVHLSGSGAGSTDSVIAVIDALTEATEYRLIVVNEKSGSFSV